jgi:hypothetical protein
MEESLKRRQSSECAYQRDPYSWALKQARVLRERRAAELDWDNLAEEIQDACPWTFEQAGDSHFLPNFGSAKTSAAKLSSSHQREF